MSPTASQKLPELRQALTGQMGAHQRFMLAEQLAHIDEFDETIAHLDTEIEETLRPFEGLRASTKTWAPITSMTETANMSSVA